MYLMFTSATSDMRAYQSTLMPSMPAFPPCIPESRCTYSTTPQLGPMNTYLCRYLADLTRVAILHVDVTIAHNEKIRVVGNHPPVAQLRAHLRWSPSQQS